MQSLPKTVGLPDARLIVLDKLRKKRNLSDYSGEGGGEEEAAACVRAAEELTTNCRAVAAEKPFRLDGLNAAAHLIAPIAPARPCGCREICTFCTASVLGGLSCVPCTSPRSPYILSPKFLPLLTDTPRT